MANRLILTRDAEADLARIADYTISQFGVRQARRYRDRLGEAMQRISDHAEIGTDQSQILPGLRRFVAGRHAIYYRIVGTDRIIILRILGPGQDPIAAL